MPKLPQMKVEFVVLEGKAYTLDELAQEIAKRLERMSREGRFKMHEKGIISDMWGVKVDG